MGDPVTFRVAPDESTVRIHATSNVHPIDGEATALDGRIELTLDANGEPDLEAPIAAEIELPVASLESGNPAYDAELRRRLDERKYPTIHGQLTSVEATDGGYRVSGNLTFHGATRTVTTPIEVSVDAHQLHARWEQTIDIRDFNLKAPRILMFKVDPEVRVEVDLVAHDEREE